LATQLGDRTLVLAVARPVAAGQEISEGDLRAVSAARDSTLRMIPAAQKAQVVGRTAAVPLVVGTLLVPGQLGRATFPPAGQASATLSLKAGQYPVGLAAGAHVSVFLPASKDTTTTESTTPSQVRASVVAVQPSASEDGSLVSLLLDEADAARLAAAGTSGLMVMQVSGS
jgi:hypothetical protein